MKNKRYRWNGIGISVVIIFVMIYGIHIINERRQDFSPSAYRYDIELPDSPKESPDGTKRLIVGIAFDTLPGGLVHLYGSVCDVATGKERIIYKDYCYVAIAGAGTVYATRSQKAKSSSDQAYELGQMIQEQDKETDTSDELYAVGKDIQITKQEMKNHEKRFALGEEDAQDSVTDDGKSSEEKAFQALVRRKTLAVAAETAGYTVSDAELDQIVSEKREAMDTGIDDPENKEYGETLKALYDSFGGEDQYWEYMREETRTSAEIEKYFADKENEYKEQLGSDGETAQPWDEAREELVDQLIAEQDVKTV